jgi:hypothetical protein
MGMSCYHYVIAGDSHLQAHCQPDDEANDRRLEEKLRNLWHLAPPKTVFDVKHEQYTRDGRVSSKLT